MPKSQYYYTWGTVFYGSELALPTKLQLFKSIEDLRTVKGNIINRQDAGPYQIELVVKLKDKDAECVEVKSETENQSSLGANDEKNSGATVKESSIEAAPDKVILLAVLHPKRGGICVKTNFKNLQKTNADTLLCESNKDSNSKRTHHDLWTSPEWRKNGMLDSDYKDKHRTMWFDFQKGGTGKYPLLRAVVKFYADYGFGSWFLHPDSDKKNKQHAREIVNTLFRLSDQDKKSLQNNPLTLAVYLACKTVQLKQKHQDDQDQKRSDPLTLFGPSYFNHRGSFALSTNFLIAQLTNGQYLDVKDVLDNIEGKVAAVQESCKWLAEKGLLPDANPPVDVKSNYREPTTEHVRSVFSKHLLD